MYRLSDIRLFRRMRTSYASLIRLASLAEDVALRMTIGDPRHVSRAASVLQAIVFTYLRAAGDLLRNVKGKSPIGPKGRQGEINNMAFLKDI